jgi:3-oxoadipate enol-lactonase
VGGIALLDHLGIEEVRVVAHSMGGRSAVALAVRDPRQRCRAIVLGGNSGGLGDDEVQERRAEAAAARGDRGLGAFSVAESYRKEHADLFFLLRQISRMNPSRPRDFLTAPVLRPASPPPTGSNHERLAATGVPVLYIVGEHDAITPPDMIEMCHQLVEDSRYYMVRGSGHSAYYEKPDEYNEVVLSFLRGTEKPGEREPAGLVKPVTSTPAS